MLFYARLVVVVRKQSKLSLDTAWLVLGMPTPENADSTLAAEATDPASSSSISRPASPGAQQQEPLLGGSDSTSANEAQPAELSRKSTTKETTAALVDVADSQFTELLVLTGCTVVLIQPNSHHLFANLVRRLYIRDTKIRTCYAI